MGMSVASDVFLKKLDEIFQNVQGVTGIADDMIIYGKSRDEQDVYFLSFLSIVRKNNLRLNASKLQFQLEEVSFFGHSWNSKVISPGPKKNQAIKQMVFPPDKESMQSFLQMVNFLNRYSPFSKSEHQQSFNAIKKELPTNIVLPYYDPTSHTTLQTDSCKKGLGAVLIQNGIPIYFASRAISTMESNYQNLE